MSRARVRRILRSRSKHTQVLLLQALLLQVLRLVIGQLRSTGVQELEKLSIAARLRFERADEKERECLKL